MLVRIGAVMVTATAFVQWWELADRASHIVRMYWKFGDFPVTASAFGLALFLASSIIGAAVGFAVVVRARQERAWPYLLARMATGALVAGAVLWPAAIMSPLVRIVER